ncbi:PPC domain-containing protein [Roseicyclus marinus]|uniref:PPC domain-containing protein n=1 Tax=Roseicyclus marinus TaxID=2161673 RepID=UPI002410662F|nr:DVUA0089 family protein [Roseicyclus marinus]MDG3042711.1 DVUA0089 family protein [Roseicyclus marinus]
MARSFIAPVATAMAFATIGLPSFAQEVSCGGIGAGAPWIGGSRAGSDVTAASAPLALSGINVAPGTRGVALFTVGSPGEVRVEAAPADEFGDTVLEVFDAAGNLVVMDDDSGGMLASRSELPLAQGDYCLAVTGFGGGPVLADLQVSRLEQPALTVGLAGGFAGTGDGPFFVGVDPCLADTPAMMLGQGPIDGMLGQGGVSATNTIAAAPYYRFTLSSAQPVTIRAENPDADPYIYVFDGQGQLLAENDDYDSLNSRIDFTAPLAPGSYCVGMRALSNPNLPVTVRVSGFDARAMAMEAYATGDAAPPLDGSYPVQALGVVGRGLTQDVTVSGTMAQWFVVDIADYGMLVVNADAVTDSDPVLSVFDAFGRNLGFNDDANGTLNSELMVRTPPGQYLIAVRQYSEGYSGIIRLGFQRFVPAP